MSRKSSYFPTNGVFADQGTKDGPARLLRKLEISAPVEITVVPTVPASLADLMLRVIVSFLAYMVSIGFFFFFFSPWKDSQKH